MPDTLPPWTGSASQSAPASSLDPATTFKSSLVGSTLVRAVFTMIGGGASAALYQVLSEQGKAAVGGMVSERALRRRRRERLLTRLCGDRYIVLAVRERLRKARDPFAEGLNVLEDDTVDDAIRDRLRSHLVEIADN